jgi:hypothetical protein
MRCLPRLAEDDLASLAALDERFEHWLRDDYHLRRHGGIDGKPLDRYLAGAEQTLIQRLAPHEVDHAFMGRLTRCVRNDATVKVDGTFYEVPPEFIGARVDLRFPVGRPEELFLYRDDAPLGRIHPVDLAENARFHAQRVELSYADLLAKREEQPLEENPS